VRHIYTCIHDAFNGGIDPVAFGGGMQTNICDPLADAQGQHLLSEEKAGEIGSRKIAFAECISEILELPGINREKGFVARLFGHYQLQRGAGIALPDNNSGFLR
jgi:hypothetical protein